MSEDSQITLWDWISGAMRSRTVRVNVILAVLGGIELAGSHLTVLLGPKMAAGILLGGSVANLVLRAITTTSLPRR